MFDVLLHISIIIVTIVCSHVSSGSVHDDTPGPSKQFDQDPPCLGPPLINLFIVNIASQTAHQ